MGAFPVKGVLVVDVEEMPVLGRDRQLDDETFTAFVVAAQPPFSGRQATRVT